MRFLLILVCTLSLSSAEDVPVAQVDTWDTIALLERHNNLTSAFMPSECAIRAKPEPLISSADYKLAVVIVFCPHGDYKPDKNTHLKWMWNLTCSDAVIYHMFAKCSKTNEGTVALEDHVPYHLRSCTHLHHSPDTVLKSDGEFLSFITEFVSDRPALARGASHILFVKDTTHFDFGRVVETLTANPGMQYLHVGEQGSGAITDEDEDKNLLGTKCSVYSYYTCRKKCKPWVMAHHTVFAVATARLRSLRVEDYILFYRWMIEPKHFHWPTEQVTILLLGCFYDQPHRLTDSEIVKMRLPGGLQCENAALVFNEDTMYHPSYSIRHPESEQLVTSYCKKCINRTISVRKSQSRYFIV